MTSKQEKNPFLVTLEAAFQTRSDGRTSHLQSVFAPDNKVAKYSKKGIYSGMIIGEEESLFDKHEWADFILDMKTSDITFFTGIRGYGKTFALRSLSNRSFRSGYATVYFDIKDECKSNNIPYELKPDMRKDGVICKGIMAKNEYPQAIPTTMCVPYFLKDTYDNPPSYYRFFQFSLMDVREDDLLYVLMPANDTYKKAISIAYGLIRKRKIKTLEQLRQFLTEHVNPQTVPSINISIDNLIEKNIFGEEHTLDVLTILNESILVYDIKNYEQYDKTGGFVHLYASMLLYKLFNMRIEGKEILKKEVDVYIDEFPFFCPKDSETYSKSAIIEMINKYRKRGFSGKFAIQGLSQIPVDKILTTIRHVFFPPTVTSGKLGKDGELEEILKTFNIWAYDGRDRKRWHEIIQNAKRRKHSWVYIDTKKATPPQLVRFFVPLGAHEEESRS